MTKQQIKTCHRAALLFEMPPGSLIGIHLVSQIFRSFEPLVYVLESNALIQKQLSVALSTYTSGTLRSCGNGVVVSVPLENTKAYSKGDKACCDQYDDGPDHFIEARTFYEYGTNAIGQDGKGQRLDHRNGPVGKIMIVEKDS